jgi:hypothetical protein
MRFMTVQARYPRGWRAQADLELRALPSRLRSDLVKAYKGAGYLNATPARLDALGLPQGALQLETLESY